MVWLVNKLFGMLGRSNLRYLMALAKSKGAQLASFDRGLAALRPDVVRLVPTIIAP